MNRRGAETAIMFFAFMLILTMILGGIVLGVNSFYGKGYDMRQTEANLLADRVEKCFNENDFFMDGFDIYQECNLNKNVIEENHLISVKDKDRMLFWGVNDFVNQCYFEAAEGNNDFPKCSERVIEKNGKEFTILIGSSQDSRRN